VRCGSGETEKGAQANPEEIPPRPAHVPICVYKGKWKSQRPKRTILQRKCLFPARYRKWAAPNGSDPGASPDPKICPRGLPRPSSVAERWAHKECIPLGWDGRNTSVGGRRSFEAH